MLQLSMMMMAVMIVVGGMICVACTIAMSIVSRLLRTGHGLPLLRAGRPEA
jgi:hypothetical protein